MLPLDRDESLHGHCERGVDWGREGHVGQGEESGQDGGQDLAAATLYLFNNLTCYLESVELAVEVYWEHEDAEDDANCVEDAELRDQFPEWDLQTELRLVDHKQWQNISWRHKDTSRLLAQIVVLPMIPMIPIPGNIIPSNSHRHVKVMSSKLNSVTLKSFNTSIYSHWL